MKSVLLAVHLVILFSFFFHSSFSAEKENSCAVWSIYVIRSLGSDIGTVWAKTSGTASDNDFRADVDVHVSFLFFRFSLKSTETTSIRGGKVLRYRKTIDNGGDHKEITGELERDMFTIVVRDGNKAERKRFPTTIYDVTNMEYPELTLVPGEVRKMRVLDLENSEVVDRSYRYVAEEQTEIEGRITRVIVADFADKNCECRRWTAVVNGIPVVKRQAGKEKTGIFNPTYSVRQTKVSVPHFNGSKPAGSD